MQNTVAWIAVLIGALLVGLFLFVAYRQPSLDSQVTFWLHKDKILPEMVTTNAGLIRFVIHNSGPGTHGFALERSDGTRVTLPHWAEEIPQDGVIFILVRLEPGEYTVYCPIRGHTGLGDLGAPVRIKEKEIAKLIVR